MENSSDSMLVEFIRYHVWATLHLLDTCQKLSPDELGSTTPGTYGTIYDTCVHLIRADAFYVFLLTGERLPPPFNWDDQPTIAQMRAAYGSQVGNALIQAAGRVKDTDVVRQDWQGETVAYRAVTVLIQAVNHGVEHRTHITTILSQLGLEPPEVDGWSYLWSNLDRLRAP
jgi:uncharacterized damage-inducible protein DinB